MTIWVFRRSGLSLLRPSIVVSSILVFLDKGLTIRSLYTLYRSVQELSTSTLRFAQHYVSIIQYQLMPPGGTNPE